LRIITKSGLSIHFSHISISLRPWCWTDLPRVFAQSLTAIIWAVIPPNVRQTSSEA
jgi:hypothetical protein